MPIAFTRAVSPRLAECETTQAGRVDVARAIAQHAAYERALAAAGLEVRRLAPLDDFPDAVFVEDTALLLGEHAVILRPGAASRAGETGSTAAGLAEAFAVRRLDAGHVDGGDVLRIGRTLYVGLSSRTDQAGLRALAETVAPLGYDIVPVPVAGGLHLKSAATVVADMLVHNPDWVPASHFAGVEPLAVAPGESLGGNVLLAGATLLAAADSPGTAAALAARGFDVVTLDISEMRKADAALTCMSLVSAPPA
ncbi:MAG TPA: N(G),N(G)-dimethylarginine dimethylaminohydrolase [Allosphingosinicella sp.]|nr:N(G),N(G)-dimethylarginine dimethylaminohydrolase [Allosphingosinicella sp.]